MNARGFQEQMSIKAHEDKYGPVGLSDSAGGVYIWPYSGGTKKHSWALYVFPDGSAQLYRELGDTGQLLGKPIKLPAPKFSQYRCEVRVGDNRSIDVIGAMLPKSAEKGFVICNLPATRLCQPNEVTDDPKAKAIWICPGHDEFTKG